MKKFKAESQRILDLMVHSIYTNKDIFLRELISNASDAIDKLHFLSLTDTALSAQFKIEISADQDAKTLTIRDNGIGMNAGEMETNLGTIANSGTLKFKEENAPEEALIGQFGVGFYAAFMVAKRVVVTSRKYNETTAFRWTSEGAKGFDITPCESVMSGTEIVLTLKEDDEDCKYSEYLNEYTLRSLIKKYSDYIRYPIMLEETRRQKKESTETYEESKEYVLVNSMVPLWKRKKQEVTDKDYADFYQQKYMDAQPVRKVIAAHIEGIVNYDALLFIPAAAPMNYYTKEFEKGLELYSSGVLIMERCADLLPEYLGFLRGLVDSSDLSLNISRELLQKDRQLAAIAKSLEKKTLSELSKMLAEDREGYEKLFTEYGTSLKFGLYNNFGEKKKELKDLMLFYSSAKRKLVTLKEYLERMQEEQKFIYYVCGRSVEAIENMPKTDYIKDKGYEILYLTDHVDEFMMKVLHEYNGIDIKSASGNDLEADEKEIETAKQSQEDNKELLEFLKQQLGQRVKDVRLSYRLKNHPVCLTADGDLSLEMERILKALDQNDQVKAERVLELNAEHPIFARMQALFAQDRALLETYALALYHEALLLEGLPIESSTELSAVLNTLMSRGI